MIQPFVHKRDIGIEPNGGVGESGLIGRPSGTYLRDDAATHFSKDRHCWRGHIESDRCEHVGMPDETKFRAGSFRR
jgi:hypothetical protein